MHADSDDKHRLHVALTERDDALQKLAAARAELEALKLSLRQAGTEPPLYPPTANPAEPAPLRYVLVDRANQTFKRLLGPLHRVVKARR